MTSNSENNIDNTNQAIMGAIDQGPSNDHVILPNQPRQPRDMRGLLRFAMESTAMEDAPHSSNFQPMDDERKKFLDEALKGLTVDLVEILTKALETLKMVGKLKPEDDPEEFENALETISDTVDNIDLANDFHKIGGFDVLIPCLTSSHQSLQWRTAEVIAELTQNNPYCQIRVLATGILPILLELVDNGPCEAVRVKALYAISCIIRDNKVGLEKFQQLDGFSVLLRAMQSNVDKLVTKSAFLLSALCSEHHTIRDDLQKLGWVHQLVGLVSEERKPSHEHLLSALLSLVRDHVPSLEDCRNPQLQLKAVLLSHIELCKAKEECQEEVDYAQQILKMVFSDGSENACAGER